MPIFFKINFFKKILSEIPSECQTVLDPDQALQFVGPDLGPNCLPRLSADDTGRQSTMAATATDVQLR